MDAGKDTFQGCTPDCESARALRTRLVTAAADAPRLPSIPRVTHICVSVGADKFRPAERILRDWLDGRCSPYGSGRFTLAHQCTMCE